MGDGYDPSYLSIELLPKLEASTHAREAIRSAFRGLPERTFDDLLLVACELVNNAVQHGPGKPIALRVSLDSKRGIIQGEVIDQGEPTKSIPRIREVTQNKGGGYGLRLVDTKTSEWYVAEGSTSVRFEIPLEAH